MIRHALLLSLLASSSLHADETLISVNGTQLEVLSEALALSDRFGVRVTAPDGRAWYGEVRDQPIPEIDLRAAFGSLPDGSYAFEIVAYSNQRPPLESVELRGLVNPPHPPVTVSGTVTALAGRLIDPNQVESRQERLENLYKASSDDMTIMDQVIADDLIVQGSLCVGFDCVDNESFGFDTIRLKENNLRIRFDDTSTSPGFPANDWEITINDSASGGANYFGITDVTAGHRVATISAGAPANSLFIDSAGRLGLRTSTPVLDLHMVSSNTPATRLEQTSTGGFSAQTWDVAGNETNFFVRDVTGGSRLPLRIRPGAPTSSLDIAASGNVGIGTASPSLPLHVTRPSGDAAVGLTNSSTSTSWRVGLGNSLGATDIFTVSYGATADSEFRIFKGGAVHIGPNGNTVFQLTPTGNLTINGTLSQLSDAGSKIDIASIEPSMVLDKLLELPLATWSYTHTPSVRHIGPMAQDFHAIFGVGESERHIATIDASGVALAAAKALAEQLQKREERIGELEARLARLEGLLSLPVAQQ